MQSDRVKPELHNPSCLLPLTLTSGGKIHTEKWSEMVVSPCIPPADQTLLPPELKTHSENANTRTRF